MKKPQFNGFINPKAAFSGTTTAHGSAPPIPTIESILSTMEDLKRRYPRRDILVCVFVPAGWPQGLRGVVPTVPTARLHSALAILGGIRVEECRNLPADAGPYGLFADGSIRPMYDTGTGGVA